MWKTITLTLALLASCSTSSESSHATTTDTDTDATANTRADTTDRPTDPMTDSSATPNDATSTTSIATFGAGCFWCVEAVLEQVDGVRSATSGYMGGHVVDPTYKQICGGDTGHAEVTQVEFDPDVISYEELLAWFWRLHDPTTLNRQGNDVGTQYRSVIFFHDAEQERIARESKAAEDASGRHMQPIVTEVTAASTYYPAEDYHQDYYRDNKSQGYCRMVIAPKLEKLGLDY